jgi:flagellar biosynthetic protein FliP
MRIKSSAISFRWWIALIAMAILLIAPTARAQETPPEAPFAKPTATTPPTSPLTAPMNLPDFSKRETFSSAMQIIILLTVLSLAPAILIMMTSFTRIIIVLSLLRQALGTQQLPPNQILMGLALFMTFIVMGPTWNRINNDAIAPYMRGDADVDQKEALRRAVIPMRLFMENQIRASGNDADVLLFTEVSHEKTPKKWEDVGTMTLIPAFMLSELKTAFYLGFKVYLPFLIIDMVISSVLISMGMMMLPPALISLPFKLLLFVLVDGWHLITGSLMLSFVT